MSSQFVIIESCGAPSNGCTCALIDTSEWEERVRRWVETSGIEEKLISRLEEGKPHHHKRLKISISGCPNGCSRPQIADFGLIGGVTAEADPDMCNICGLCAEACPDNAIFVHENAPRFGRELCLGCTKCRDACPENGIKLSEPFVRLMAGGKLGRHPRLAEVIGTHTEPDETIKHMDRLSNSFAADADPSERFAEYIGRTDYGR